MVLAALRAITIGWFWIDAPSSLPVELLTLMMDGTSSQLSLLRFLRMFRLLRLLRLLKVRLSKNAHSAP